MNEIKTVFGFTVRSAVRKKPFKVTTIVLLALILIVVLVVRLVVRRLGRRGGRKSAKGYSPYRGR